eukprot:g7560.t1
MSNPLLNSAASSALISSLDSVSSKKNPFTYSYAQKGSLASAHVPSHSRSAITSYATSIGFNQNIDFPILKNGILEGLFVKIVLTAPAGARVNAAVANLIIESMSLITSGREICSSRPFGRAALTAHKPYSVKKNIEKMLGLQAARYAPQNNQVVAYIPAFFSCFDSPEQMYLSTFVEPLTLRLKMGSANQYADDNAGGAVNLTLTTCELVQVFRNLSSDAEQKMIMEDYSNSESLVRIQYDLVEENTVKAGTADATDVFTHKFTSNRTCSKIFFALERVAADITGGEQIASAADGQYGSISRVIVKGNGMTLFDLDADLFKYALSQDTDSANSMFSVGAQWDTSFPHTANIYKIDWGMNTDNSHLTNNISLREINDFQLIVHSTATANNVEYRLRVCMLSPQLEAINSASGKISTSLSS